MNTLNHSPERALERLATTRATRVLTLEIPGDMPLMDLALAFVDIGYKLDGNITEGFRAKRFPPIFSEYQTE